MPPYRARLGGPFGSGYFPQPVQQIDVGQAITAIGREATSLLNTRYLQKVAEQNRAAAAKSAAAAQDAQRAERAQRLTMDQERLMLDRQRLERPPVVPLWEREGFASREDYLAFQRQLADARRGPERPAGGERETRGERDAADAEADAAVWFETQKKNPEVAALLGTVYRVNPELARTPNKAYAIVRRNYERAREANAPAPVPRPNGEQEKSFLFWRGMSAADPVITRFGPRANLDNVSAALAATTPASAAAANRLLTPEEQQLVSAIRSFGEPILRKNTGAAFGNDEILWVFQQFVPLSGDSPETQAMKTANRARVLQDFGTLAIPARRYYDAQRGGQRDPGNTPTPEDVSAAMDASGGAVVTTSRGKTFTRVP